jgi:hypothetical protein
VDGKLAAAGTPNAREITNDTDFEWTATADFTALYVAFFDASTSGNLVAWASIAPSMVMNGQVASLQPDQVRFTIT